ncbi:activator-dependent family glycosyltransferase [Streptomyces kanamyceticus]|uniref:Activator-dependent family glycosyltransferase n=1 Tax=Streptomyces kanamyceticus TaxID=1967 RepID=A0A5J6GMG0_STRKN|nr:activator-dependent family glycosyltransferase [Streptomyces kanamyceticus]QEU96263.1 activator-dependent family glycosyltransferase [Streptomyces kanamyceticus]
MRVLFTTLAAATHLHAQVPLAWALRAAGHEVRVASQPDLVDDIVRTGLTAVPVGRALDPQQWADVSPLSEADLNREENIWNAQGGIAWDLFDLCELRPEHLTYSYMHCVLEAWISHNFRQTSSPETVDDLVAFARQWRPDLVIWDPTTFAGAVAAMATGAAHARLMFGFDVLGRMRGSYLDALRERPPEHREDPFEEWLGPLLERYGSAFSEEAVVGRWTIDPVPSSLRLEVDHPYLPVRYVPYNGHSTIPGWLRTPARGRRVCLTLGRSFRELLGGDRASVAELLDAVAELDIEVVATLNAAQLAELPRLPDNVRAVDFVPLDALLPSCSAIIHHSGSGTTQTALAHGVPQVVVPALLFDNLLKARRIEEAGAGLHVREGQAPTATTLRDMLVRVLEEPSFTRRAQELRREMLGTPSPRELVPVLERLTEDHRGGTFAR